MPDLIQPPKPTSRALLQWLFATVILPLIAGVVSSFPAFEGSFVFAIPIILTSLVMLSISSERLAGEKRSFLEITLLLGGLFLMFGMLSSGCMITSLNIPNQH